jgi:hypothetical protein
MDHTQHVISLNPRNWYKTPQGGTINQAAALHLLDALF